MQPKKHALTIASLLSYDYVYQRTADANAERSPEILKIANLLSTKQNSMPFRCRIILDDLTSRNVVLQVSMLQNTNTFFNQISNIIHTSFQIRIYCYELDSFLYPETPIPDALFVCECPTFRISYLSTPQDSPHSSQDEIEIVDINDLCFADFHKLYIDHQISLLTLSWVAVMCATHQNLFFDTSFMFHDSYQVRKLCTLNNLEQILQSTNEMVERAIVNPTRSDQILSHPQINSSPDFISKVYQIIDEFIPQIEPQYPFLFALDYLMKHKEFNALSSNRLTTLLELSSNYLECYSLLHFAIRSPFFDDVMDEIIRKQTINDSRHFTWLSFIPNGIQNPSHFCYLACIFQMFASSYNLINILMTIESPSILIKHIQELIVQLFLKNTYPSLLHILEDLKHIASFDLKRQQDLSEIFSYIINHFLQHENNGEHFASQFQISYDEILKNNTTGEVNPIHWQSHVLSLTRYNSSISIESNIKEMFLPRTESYSRNHIIQTHYQNITFPNYLCIQLPKGSHFHSLEHNLSIQMEENDRHHLSAIIFYSGTGNAGHYFIAINHTDHWIVANDNITTICRTEDIQQICNCNMTYMLMYVRFQEDICQYTEFSKSLSPIDNTIPNIPYFDKLMIESIVSDEDTTNIKLLLYSVCTFFIGDENASAFLIDKMNRLLSSSAFPDLSELVLQMYDIDDSWFIKAINFPDNAPICFFFDQHKVFDALILDKSKGESILMKIRQSIITNQEFICTYVTAYANLLITANIKYESLSSQFIHQFSDLVEAHCTPTTKTDFIQFLKHHDHYNDQTSEVNSSNIIRDFLHYIGINSFESFSEITDLSGVYDFVFHFISESAIADELRLCIEYFLYTAKNVLIQSNSIEHLVLDVSGMDTSNISDSFTHKVPDKFSLDFQTFNIVPVFSSKRVIPSSSKIMLVFIPELYHVTSLNEADYELTASLAIQNDKLLFIKMKDNKPYIVNQQRYITSKEKNIKFLFSLYETNAPREIRPIALEKFILPNNHEPKTLIYSCMKDESLNFNPLVFEIGSQPDILVASLRSHVFNKMKEQYEFLHVYEIRSYLNQSNFKEMIRKVYGEKGETIITYCESNQIDILAYPFNEIDKLFDIFSQQLISPCKGYILSNPSITTNENLYQDIKLTTYNEFLSLAGKKFAQECLYAWFCCFTGRHQEISQIINSRDKIRLNADQFKAMFTFALKTIQKSNVSTRYVPSLKDAWLEFFIRNRDDCLAVAKTFNGPSRSTLFKWYAEFKKITMPTDTVFTGSDLTVTLNFWTAKLQYKNIPVCISIDAIALRPYVTIDPAGNVFGLIKKIQIPEQEQQHYVNNDEAFLNYLKSLEGKEKVIIKAAFVVMLVPLCNLQSVPLKYQFAVHGNATPSIVTMLEQYIQQMKVDKRFQFYGCAFDGDKGYIGLQTKFLAKWHALLKLYHSFREFLMNVKREEMIIGDPCHLMKRGRYHVVNHDEFGFDLSQKHRISLSRVQLYHLLYKILPEHTWKNQRSTRMDDNYARMFFSPRAVDVLVQEEQWQYVVLMLPNVFLASYYYDTDNKSRNEKCRIITIVFYYVYIIYYFQTKATPDEEKITNSQSIISDSEDDNETPSKSGFLIDLQWAKECLNTCIAILIVLGTNNRSFSTEKVGSMPNERFFSGTRADCKKKDNHDMFKKAFEKQALAAMMKCDNTTRRSHSSYPGAIIPEGKLFLKEKENIQCLEIALFLYKKLLKAFKMSISSVRLPYWMKKTWEEMKDNQIKEEKCKDYFHNLIKTMIAQEGARKTKTQATSADPAVSERSHTANINDILYNANVF